jgi:low affinity Fe/Cu permease
MTDTMNSLTPPATRNGGQRKLNDRFNRIADGLTRALGSFWALLGSVLVVVVWALTGPIFNFSDTWQLFINTSTTVITFWMVFVIQNSANRDAKAVHLKLDELIRSVESARNSFITLERAPEDVVAEREAELARVAEDDARAASTDSEPQDSGAPNEAAAPR